jgi:hypothetical protein
MKYRCLAECLLGATLILPGCELSCERKPERSDYAAQHASLQQVPQQTLAQIPKNLEAYLIDDPDLKMTSFYGPKEFSEAAGIPVKNSYFIKYKTNMQSNIAIYLLLDRTEEHSNALDEKQMTSLVNWLKKAEPEYFSVIDRINNSKGLSLIVYKYHRVGYPVELWTKGDFRAHYMGIIDSKIVDKDDIYNKVIYESDGLNISDKIIMHGYQRGDNIAEIKANRLIVETSISALVEKLAKIRESNENKGLTTTSCSDLLQDIKPCPIIFDEQNPDNVHPVSSNSR